MYRDNRIKLSECIGIQGASVNLKKKNYNNDLKTNFKISLYIIVFSHRFLKFPQNL